MNRRTLLFRLLFKAAWVRKDRALTALISVAVVATIATTALTIYSDLEGRLSREFRGFGANVVVTKTAAALTADDLAGIRSMVGGASEVVPVAYAIGTETRTGSKVVVGGVDLAKLRRLNPAWSFTDEKQGSALVGWRVNESIARGGDLQLSFGGTSNAFKTAAVFHSGSDDD